MQFTIEAACGCHTGNIRKTNEDNFFFEGKCLPADNTGLKTPVSFTDGIQFGSYMTADLLLLAATFLSACLKVSTLAIPIVLTAKGFLVSFVIIFYYSVFIDKSA